MNLFAALLVAVAMTHLGYDPLCALIPGLKGAQAGVFYVLRGLEGVALFTIIGILRPAVWSVCAWGAFEEGETAVCRLAGGFSQVPTVAPWHGLCDDLTGLPTYMIGVVAAAIFVRTRAAK